MKKVETIEEFYRRKFDWMPDNIRKEIGHFNVFKLEPLVEGKPTSIPYKRRDFYKIMLVIGNSKVHYADKVVEVQKQALSFSNPQIPYKWEHLDRIRSGVYCIFNQHFFHQFGNLNQYSLFQPGGTHIFELTDEQVNQVTVLYQRIFEEINSEYVHKYDVLRTIVLELIHFALKMQPSEKLDKQPINASQRIATLFLELLERQFPIDDNHKQVTLRSASDYAGQLHVHVNHLNRAVKEITQKTTTQLIAERVLQEARILLKHSNWTVAEIAYALGFTEPTHFNNFFKKHTQTSPLQFRKV
ncbi:MAG: AraC family transcriptional regulator [Chitinophagaceae bacterium]|nr:AraC family transcriptional regulator [Chitinophagaceae bacterium]MEA3427265.1 helix-turn-helix transcriptional regulator [Bacteroidota bacterium]MCA6452923.1 AraC family transcriptional regulator [Chitinophagaceae bacterium]MCA6456255.1 AraC family transcriptional regulator [Chitinophagaceae bacterium]MCA6460525.1 AraC family transcriptional regulator [Chitinophagaceae bacterium]